MQTRLPFREFTPSSNVIVNDRTGKRASRPPITAAVGLTKTNTLSVWDRVTGTSFPVDTGADVCVFLASSNDKRKRTPTENLTAANGSKIDTWGQCVIAFILGQGKRYHQKFYLADVARPILGANFFTANNIAINLRGRLLVDLNHSNILAAYTERTPNSHCCLVLGATSRFNQLLLQFPQILAPSLQNQVSKHGVEHYIVTSGPPVHSRPWRLTAQKLALAQAEFQQLEWAGIIRRSNSPWSTPLHMVPNPLGDGDRAAIIAAFTKLPSTIVTRYLTFTISTHDWQEQNFFPK